MILESFKVKSLSKKPLLFGFSRHSMQQCTEGWECNLGFQGLKFFFGNNGLGGFLGPHWKVFHHGTLSGHFQGVVLAFGSQPGGEKMDKIK